MLTSQASGVTSVAISSNGLRGFPASRDKMPKVWEVDSGAVIATFILRLPRIAQPFARDAGYPNFVLLVNLTSGVFYAIADRLLVNIEPDVIHMSFEAPQCLFSESTFPLSSAFVPHVLLLDLAFKQTGN